MGYHPDMRYRVSHSQTADSNYCVGESRGLTGRNMLFGYDQGVMGGFLTSAPFERTFPSISNGNATLQGFTVAVYEIGCAAGSLSVIFGGDRFGRRMTVMLGQAILIVGAM